MITVISGTNRPQSNTRTIVGLVEETLVAAGRRVTVLDLAELPAELFLPSSYRTKPVDFARFQDGILAGDGILTVVPEYNGSFPGVLKYFVDMLRFPESLIDTPAAFIGLSSGRWGAVRAVEQLEMVFQYRRAHLFGTRVFLPTVTALLDENGRLLDAAAERRVREMVLSFADFCDRVGGRPSAPPVQPL